MAMLVYAVSRTTRDLDIVFELTPVSLPSFFSIFNNRFYVHKDSITEEVKRTGVFNVIDQDTGLKVDFVVKKIPLTASLSLKGGYATAFSAMKRGLFPLKI